jgi:hypothetical protein
MRRITWAPKIVVSFLFIYNYSIAEFNVGLVCNNSSLTTTYEKFNYKPDIKIINIP